MIPSKNYTTSPTDPTNVLTAGEFDVHPMANIVPLDGNTDTLVNSIRKTGLLHPLLMYKGKIIDGRRRAIACAILGITPEVNDIGSDRNLTDAEVYDIVLAENNRRNISQAQKAMVAAIQVSNMAHHLAGYTRALDYVNDVWGVNKNTYAKAKYVLKYGRAFAYEIFSTGFADVDGKSMTMNKVWEMLKEVQDSKSNFDGVGSENLTEGQIIARMAEEIAELKAKIDKIAKGEVLYEIKPKPEGA